MPEHRCAKARTISAHKHSQICSVAPGHKSIPAAHRAPAGPQRASRQRSEQRRRPRARPSTARDRIRARRGKIRRRALFVRRAATSASERRRPPRAPPPTARASRRPRATGSARRAARDGFQLVDARRAVREPKEGGQEPHQGRRRRVQAAAGCGGHGELRGAVRDDRRGARLRRGRPPFTKNPAVGRRRRQRDDRVRRRGPDFAREPRRAARGRERTGRQEVLRRHARAGDRQGALTAARRRASFVEALARRVLSPRGYSRVRVAATPQPRRGYSADESRRRRGCDVEIRSRPGARRRYADDAVALPHFATTGVRASGRESSPSRMRGLWR